MTRVKEENLLLAELKLQGNGGREGGVRGLFGSIALPPTKFELFHSFHGFWDLIFWICQYGLEDSVCQIVSDLSKR